MIATLLVIHIIICIALIGAILLQRSEGGGALGIGGGPGSMLSGKGAANFMTRTTGILAAMFFVTSATLTVLSGIGNKTAKSVVSGQDKNGLPTEKVDLGDAPANKTGSAIPASDVAPKSNAGSAFETSTVTKAQDAQKAAEEAKAPETKTAPAKEKAPAK